MTPWVSGLTVKRDRQGEKQCHGMTTATLGDLKRKLCLFSDLHWNPSHQNTASTMTIPITSAICVIRIMQRQGIYLYQGSLNSNTRFLFSHVEGTSQRTSFRKISLGKRTFLKRFSVAINHPLTFNPLVHPTDLSIRDTDQEIDVTLIKYRYQSIITMSSIYQGSVGYPLCIHCISLPRKFSLNLP